MYSNKYVYNINYNEPGIIVIFNNSFNNTDFERKGSENDVSRLIDVFEDVNFKIEAHFDLKATMLRKLIKEYGQRDYSDKGCFICVIMSHGSNGKIKSSDNQDINITEFFDPFKTNMSLKGKPKLFFIQACRGENESSNHDGSEQLERDSEELEEDSVSSKIHFEADFLFGNATVKGYYALRDVNSGSLYIQKLCDVICQYPEEEISQLLTRVNNLANRKIMMPNFKSQLRKKLFLTNPNRFNMYWLKLFLTIGSIFNLYSNKKTIKESHQQVEKDNLEKKVKLKYFPLCFCF